PATACATSTGAMSLLDTDPARVPIDALRVSWLNSAITPLLGATANGRRSWLGCGLIGHTTIPKSVVRRKSQQGSAASGRRISLGGAIFSAYLSLATARHARANRLTLRALDFASVTKKKGSPCPRSPWWTMTAIFSLPCL